MGGRDPLQLSDHPVLDLEEALSPGEAGPRGHLMAHLPQVGPRKQLHVPPGPRAVPDLAEVRTGQDAEIPGRGERRGRLPAPLQRARIDGVDRHAVEPRRQALGLLAAGVREVDPRGPSAQHAAVGGCGDAVADQYEEHRGRIAPAAWPNPSDPGVREVRDYDSRFGESWGTTRWKEVPCACHAVAVSRAPTTAIPGTSPWRSCRTPPRRPRSPRRRPRRTSRPPWPRPAPRSRRRADGPRSGCRGPARS